MVSHTIFEGRLTFSIYFSRKNESVQVFILLSKLSFTKKTTPLGVRAPSNKKSPFSGDLNGGIECVSNKHPKGWLLRANQ